jgi:hypothetical protein
MWAVLEAIKISLAAAYENISAEDKGHEDIQIRTCSGYAHPVPISGFCS